MRVKLKDTIESPVRLSFPDLLQPSGYNPDGNPGFVPKYGCHLVFAEGSDAHKEIEAKVSALAKEKLGAEWQKDLRLILKKGECYAMCDGEEKYGEGMLYASAKSKTRPKLIAKDGSQVLDEGVLYSGCHVHAIFDVYYTAKGGKKICAELKGVRFSKDGDQFSGGGSVSDDEFAEFGEYDAADEMSGW